MGFWHNLQVSLSKDTWKTGFLIPCTTLTQDCWKTSESIYPQMYHHNIGINPKTHPTMSSNFLTVSSLLGINPLCARWKLQVLHYFNCYKAQQKLNPGTFKTVLLLNRFLPCHVLSILSFPISKSHCYYLLFQHSAILLSTKFQPPSHAPQDLAKHQKKTSITKHP